jgi:NADPH-dependent 7-cyano-7-deazaguanine reductase QueF-like protein
MSATIPITSCESTGDLIKFLVKFIRAETLYKVSYLNEKGKRTAIVGTIVSFEENNVVIKGHCQDYVSRYDLSKLNDVKPATEYEKKVWEKNGNDSFVFTPYTP